MPGSKQQSTGRELGHRLDPHELGARRREKELIRAKPFPEEVFPMQMLPDC